MGLNSIAMAHWASLRCAAQHSIRKRGLSLLKFVTLEQGGPDKMVFVEKKTKHSLMYPDVLSQTYGGAGGRQDDPFACILRR